jgi:hypothetical protein
MIEGYGSGSNVDTSDQWIRIRIQEAQKHTDPDTDPKHCLFVVCLPVILSVCLLVCLSFFQSIVCSYPIFLLQSFLPALPVAVLPTFTSACHLACLPPPPIHADLEKMLLNSFCLSAAFLSDCHPVSPSLCSPASLRSPPSFCYSPPTNLLCCCIPVCLPAVLLICLLVMPLVCLSVILSVCLLICLAVCRRLSCLSLCLCAVFVLSRLVVCLSSCFCLPVYLHIILMNFLHRNGTF